MVFTAKERIVKTRIRFLYDNPFFATLSLYLNIKEVKEIGSMGVDFKGNLYFAEEFINSLSDEQLKTVIAHETLHLALSHLIRKGNRDQFVWNVATDLAINSMLHEQGFNIFKGILYHKQFNGMCAEEIYEKLPKPKSKGRGIIVIDGDNFKDSDRIDKHIYPKSENDKKGKGKKGEILTQQERKQLENEWKKRLVEATTLAKQMGKLPLGMERYVEEVLKSKISWRHLLYKYVTQEIPHDYTYSRPHRRSESVGFYMPSVVKECVELVVAVDTSGSIGQREYDIFISELVAIVKSFANIKITILSCDTQIHDIIELTNGNLEKICNLKLRGYGGTDFRPIFKWIGENKPNTKLLVYLTDGMGEYPEYETVRTLWVLTQKYNTPFGDKIIVDFGSDNYKS